MSSLTPEQMIDKIFQGNEGIPLTAKPIIIRCMTEYASQFIPKSEALCWVEIKSKNDLPPISWRGYVLTERNGVISGKLATYYAKGWIIDNDYDDAIVIKWLNESPSSIPSGEALMEENKTLKEDYNIQNHKYAECVAGQLHLKEENKRLREALQICYDALKDLVRQLPVDESLANYNLDFAELAEEKAKQSLNTVK